MPHLTIKIFLNALPIVLSLYATFASAQTTVNVAMVKASDIKAELTLTGNIVSTQSVAAGSEVSAQVKEIFAEVGDIVEQGQALIQLQDEPAQLELAIKQAQLREDEAGVTLATLEEQRLKKLLKQKSVSAERYDQANARLRQAKAVYAAREAEIALLMDTIDRHTLKAPFAGVITAKPVEQGSWADVGTVLMRVASLQSLRMEVSVPQRYYSALSRSDSDLKATINFDKSQNPIATTVERLVPFADEQRNFQVWLDIDNSENRWLPGMSANTKLQWKNDDTHVLLIPRDALVRKVSGQPIVWKVENGTEPENWQVQSIKVKTGTASGKHIAISADGLQVGDRVVIRGNENLRPEQQIKPVLLHEASPH